MHISRPFPPLAQNIIINNNPLPLHPNDFIRKCNETTRISQNWLQEAHTVHGNIVVFGEYVLIEVANSDVIWAAQLAAINNSVIYASRVRVGNPLMGNVSDLLGQRVGLMTVQGSFLASMALFVYFPSIFTLLGGSCLA